MLINLQWLVSSVSQVLLCLRLHSSLWILPQSKISARIPYRARPKSELHYFQWRSSYLSLSSIYIRSVLFNRANKKTFKCGVAHKGGWERKTEVAARLCLTITNCHACHLRRQTHGVLVVVDRPSSLLNAVPFPYFPSATSTSSVNTPWSEGSIELWHWRSTDQYAI